MYFIIAFDRDDVIFVVRRRNKKKNCVLFDWDGSVRELRRREVKKANSVRNRLLVWAGRVGRLAA
jgi:hypothetical protein